MAEIALCFLRMNLAAAAAVLLIAALRGPVRKTFGAQAAYSLWIAVPLAAAAMLMPARTVPVTFMAQVAAPIFPVTGLVAARSAIAATSFDPMTVVICLWALGVVAALMLTIRNQRRFVLAAAKGDVGPAVVGVVRPRIITPADFAGNFSASEQDLVLAHERLHIRRQDSRLNGLVVLVQCLCWFNPMIHWGARLLRLDQEMACDEAVLTRFPGARADYARALLKAQLANRPLPLGCYWPSGTGHPLVERLTMINREGSSRARRLTGAAVVALLAVGEAAAAWAAQPARTVAVFTPAPVVADTSSAPSDAVRQAVLATQAAKPSSSADRDEGQVETVIAAKNTVNLIRSPDRAGIPAPDTVAAHTPSAALSNEPVGADTSQPNEAIPSTPSPEERPLIQREAVAASEQTVPTPTVEKVQIPVVGPSDWIRRPTPDQMQALLPQDITTSGLKGDVVLRCRVSSVGVLSDCLVFAQSTPSADLRTTALKAAALFRIKPRMVNGRPAEEVLLPIKFNVRISSVRDYPSQWFPSFDGYNGQQPVQFTRIQGP